MVHPESLQLAEDPMHANTRVIIIGGGIGGLAAALALALRGFRVKVLEKDESFLARKQGYGLTLQQGSASLLCLGVAEHVAAASTWSQSHFIFDSRGQIVAMWGPTWTREVAGWEKGGFEVGGEQWRQVAGHNLHIPRQALREILLNALLSKQEGAVVWGAQVLNMSQADGVRGDGVLGETEGREGEAREGGGHVVITLVDGRQVVGDCCIGSDGIHSKTRHRLVHNTPPLRYLGYIVVLGIFENAKFPLCQHRQFQTADGSGARLFAMPYTDCLSMSLTKKSMILCYR
jgi:2-polyprenyl-6-methoxyphenol hydroxylase-like FAD-dependent oxidoreductase